MASTTTPRLREARQTAGFTQQELAAMVGAKQPHIARWESGTALPRVDTALRLADAVGATVETIWGLDDDNN